MSGDGAFKRTLKTPVMAHGQEITEIVLREPIAKEITEIGLPTLIVMGAEGSTGVEIRTKVVAKYISKLAAVPMSTVDQLHRSDLAALTAGVMGFFGESDGSEDQPGPANDATTRH